MTTMGAQFAGPAARPHGLVRGFFLSPFDPACWRSAGAIILGFFTGTFAFAFMATFFSTGGSMLVILIGIAFIGIGIEVARISARVERWRMTLVDPRPLIPHGYKPLRGGLRGVAEAEFMDENRWRDVIYVLVSFPLTMLEFALCSVVWSICLALLFMPLIWYEVAHVLGDRLPLAAREVMPPITVGMFFGGLFLIPVGLSLARGLMVLHRAVVAGLLCTSETAELRQRVESLRDSRSAMLQIEASELRRIERDLHDGAQQRLVMLAIDLSLASDKVDKDPAAAKQLMGDAREQARQALAELRDLVRGSAPAILLDRGLVAALGSVAGRCPVPTMVESTLTPGERQPHAVERAAYFVVSEALTNVAKHAAAGHCEIRCARIGDWLVVEVWDDGKGGASMNEGGGLTGLRDRVEALDGRFLVSSPQGGPTVLRAEFPVGVPPQQ